MINDFCIFNDDSIPFRHEVAEGICSDFLCTVRDIRKRLRINIVRCRNPDVLLIDLPVIESGEKLLSLRTFFNENRTRGVFRDLRAQFLSFATRGYFDEVVPAEDLVEDCFEFARRTGAPLLGFGDKGQDKQGLRYLSMPDHVIEEWKHRCTLMDFNLFCELFPNLSCVDSGNTIPLCRMDRDVFCRLVQRVFIPLQLFAEVLGNGGARIFSVENLRTYLRTQDISEESASVKKNFKLAKERYFPTKESGSVYFPFHVKENDKNGAIRIYVYWGEGGQKIYLAITRHLQTQRH